MGKNIILEKLRGVFIKIPIPENFLEFLELFLN
jgi:hypothetical protein